MACPEGQKVGFGTYTLVEEAEYWWEKPRQCLGSLQEGISREIFF